jgi:hypothetical protein
MADNVADDITSDEYLAHFAEEMEKLKTMDNGTSGASIADLYIDQLSHHGPYWDDIDEYNAGPSYQHSPYLGRSYTPPTRPPASHPVFTSKVTYLPDRDDVERVLDRVDELRDAVADLTASAGIHEKLDAMDMNMSELRLEFEARLQKLEQAQESMAGDLRAILAILRGAAGGMAGGTAGGTGHSSAGGTAVPLQ